MDGDLKKILSGFIPANLHVLFTVNCKHAEKVCRSLIIAVLGIVDESSLADSIV